MDNRNDEVTQTQLIADSQSVPASKVKVGSVLRSLVMPNLQHPCKKKTQLLLQESLPPSDPIEQSFESTAMRDEASVHIGTRSNGRLITRAPNSIQDVEMLGSSVSLMYGSRMNNDTPSDTQAESNSSSPSLEDPIETFPSLDADQAIDFDGRHKTAIAGKLECECGVSVRNLLCHHLKRLTSV